MRWLAALFIVTGAVHAQSVRPPAGVNVTETRVVRLPSRFDGPCIAVQLENGTVNLSRAELEGILNATPATWQTEAERLALVRGKRAGRLISALTSSTTADGCGIAMATNLADEGYLMLELLEEGHAVVRTKEGMLVPEIQVRYLGHRCGPLCGSGDILIIVPSSPWPPLLGLQWWVS